MMDEKTTSSLMELVSRVTEDHFLVAALTYGSRVAGYARKDSLYDCLAVCDYPGGTRYYHERLDDKGLAILEIDNELFQLDVKKGALGEFIAGRMLFPYVALKGTEYLTEKEIELKERVVKEETEDLIRQYGEASRGLVINPEYFALSHMLRRSRTYPPLRYSYLSTFCRNLRQRNMSRVMPGYLKAIDRLVNQTILDESSEGVIVRDEFIDRVLSRKTKDTVINVAEVSKRALYSYLMHGRAGFVSPELISRELASKVRRELLLTSLSLHVENPAVHLSLRTAKGLVPLDERGTIKDIIMKIRPNSKIVIRPLGGVLNEVYLVSANGDKLVVKVFTDWHGFKWFTLNLVTLGTKVFSVSGKARLSNEFGMSHLLRRSGIHTPEILHVSLPNKMLVERYIEGCTLVETVRQVVRNEACPERFYDDIVEVGEIIAKVHSHGIQIGDSKPENFLKGPTGAIHIIDLEQARKGGDFAWDIAEFLYYSAHYATAQVPGIRRLAEAFIEGYVGEGDPVCLRKAAGLSYLKVFSFWALPQVNYSIPDILRKASQ
jgi:tRNA A-37 threonylcarbamoyl transferase component Bud32